MDVGQHIVPVCVLAGTEACWKVEGKLWRRVWMVTLWTCKHMMCVCWFPSFPQTMSTIIIIGRHCPHYRRLLRQPLTSWHHLRPSTSAFSMATSTTPAAYFITKNLPLKYFEHEPGKYRVDMWEKEGDVPRTELLKRVKGKQGLCARSPTESIARCSRRPARS